MAKGKHNNLQNTAQKTKVRAVRTLLNSVVYTSAPEGWAVPAPHVAIVVLLFYIFYQNILSTLKVHV
jgi:hypothetical protein